MMFFYQFITIECVYIVCFFFNVYRSANAARSSLNGVCRRNFHGKGMKLKTYPQSYVISLCGIVQSGRSEWWAEGAGIESCLVHYFLFLLSFFFSPVFCVVVLYKYIRKWLLKKVYLLWRIWSPIRHILISHIEPYLSPKILHKHCFQYPLGRLPVIPRRN